MSPPPSSDPPSSNLPSSTPLSSAEVPLSRRFIFAMGGGGFTMEPNNPLLDDFVLSLGAARSLEPAYPLEAARARGATSALGIARPPSADRPHREASHQDGAPTGIPAHAREPHILFLPTASGDTGAQIHAFHARFADRYCVAEHLSLFRLHDLRRSLQDTVLSQDVLYVGGGSMRNLLAIWRAHHLDRLLIRAWRRGIVLAGISAGAMCWFQGGITRSSGSPEPLAGLGLLAGSLTVHADGEPERLPVWLAAIRDGRLPGGWSLDDGVGLLFRGEHIERTVSSRPGAGAQRVDAIAGELVRHRLTPELLGAEHSSSPLGTIDEDVQELRRVHRLRRGIAREPEP